MFSFGLVQLVAIRSSGQSSFLLTVFALAVVVSTVLLVVTLVSSLIDHANNPGRNLRARLRSLKAGAAGKAGKLDVFESVRLFDFDLAMRQGLGNLLEVPVLRIFAKPAAIKLEQQSKQALRDSCMNDLPEMVDILSLSLGAGLSIDQAFEWYLTNFETPLAGEFRRAEQAYQVGMLSRMKAFEELAESLQEEAVLRFVNALRQAFTLGSALGPALEMLSQDVRKYRVARIEERIAKTPVKILPPLGLCIVPAVLILLMGPIMSQVLQGFQL